MRRGYCVCVCQVAGERMCVCGPRACVGSDISASHAAVGKGQKDVKWQWDRQRDWRSPAACYLSSDVVVVAAAVSGLSASLSSSTDSSAICCLCCNPPYAPHRLFENLSVIHRQNTAPALGIQIGALAASVADCSDSLSLSTNPGSWRLIVISGAPQASKSLEQWFSTWRLGISNNILKG